MMKARKAGVEILWLILTPRNERAAQNRALGRLTR